MIGNPIEGAMISVADGRAHWPPSFAGGTVAVGACTLFGEPGSVAENAG
jgi:hypothetical protein